MSSTTTETRSKQLDTWCALFDGCTRISQLKDRQHTTTLGVVQRLRLVPGESLTATITDGTGKLRAVWTGRETVEGLELGSGLRLEGTVSIDGSSPVMRNPIWCLVRDPYSCASKDYE